MRRKRSLVTVAAFAAAASLLSDATGTTPLDVNYTYNSLGYPAGPVFNNTVSTVYAGRSLTTVNLTAGNTLSASGPVEIGGGYEVLLNGGSLTASAIVTGGGNSPNTPAILAYNSGSLTLTSSPLDVNYTYNSLGYPAGPVFNNTVSTVYAGRSLTTVNLTAGDALAASGPVEIGGGYEVLLNGGALTASAIVTGGGNSPTTPAILAYNSGSLTLTNSALDVGYSYNSLGYPAGPVFNNTTSVTYAGRGLTAVNLTAGDTLAASGPVEIGGGYEVLLNGGALTASAIVTGGGNSPTTPAILAYNSGSLTLTNSALDVGYSYNSLGYPAGPVFNNTTSVTYAGRGLTAVNLTAADTLAASGPVEIGGGYEVLLNGGALTASAIATGGGNSPNTPAILAYNSGSLTLTSSPLDVNYTYNSLGYPAGPVFNNTVSTVYAGRSLTTVNLTAGNTLAASGPVEIGGGYEVLVNGGALTASAIVTGGGNSPNTPAILAYNSGSLTLTSSPLDVNYTYNSLGYPAGPVFNNTVSTVYAGRSLTTVNLTAGNALTASGPVEIGGGYEVLLNGGALTASAIVTGGGNSPNTPAILAYNSGSLTLTSSPLDVNYTYNSLGYPAGPVFNNTVSTVYAGRSLTTVNLIAGNTLAASGPVEIGGGYEVLVNGGALTASAIVTGGGNSPNTPAILAYNSGSLTLTSSPLDVNYTYNSLGYPAGPVFNNTVSTVYAGRSLTTVNLTAGNTLTASGPVEIGGGYEVLLNGGSLTASAIVTGGGNSPNTPAILAYNSGSLTLTNSALDVGYSYNSLGYPAGPVFNNTTSVTYAGRGLTAVNLTAGDTISVSGPVEIGGGYEVLLNGGSLTASAIVTGGGNSPSSPAILAYTSGTLKLTQQQINVGPGGLFGNAFRVGPGASVTFGGGVTVQAAGTLALSGGSLAVGALNASANPSGFTWTAGTLAILGSGSAFGRPLTIPSGGTLAGSGTTGADALTLGAGATITGGTGATASDTTGTLTLGGALNLSGGSYLVKINATTATTDATSQGLSTGADELVVSGLLSATPSGLAIAPMALTSAASFAVGKSYSFVIADAVGARNAGVFDALILRGQITYPTSNANGTYQLATLADSTGTGGEDLVLNFMATPEPTSLLLAAIAAGPLALCRRHRQGRQH